MFAVVVAMLAAGFDVDRMEIGPLRVEVAKPSREIGFDDPLVIQITVQFPTTVSVEPLAVKAGDMLDSALVADVRIEGPDQIKGPFGAIIVANWKLTLEPTKIGPLSLPKLKTRYREKGRSIVPAEIPLPSFDVKPGRIAVGPEDKLTLPPPISVESRSNLAWWMKVVGGGSLFLCLGSLWGIALKSKSPTDERRDAIEAATGDPRTAITEICNVVRSHLEQTHRFSADHLTVPELLDDDELLESLPNAQREALREVLPLADMLRFPQPEPTVEDVDRCRRLALRIVVDPNQG